MVEIHPYRLSLHRPLNLPGRGAIRQREGCLIRFADGGWGDACPLPGFSSETFGEVLAALRSYPIHDISYPSVRFAWECAQTPWPPVLQPCRVNALWLMQEESLPDLLQRLHAWKSPVLKVKPEGPDALQKLLQLTSQRPDVRLRIDANRRWTVEQTLHFYTSIPGENLAYFEEPLVDAGAYAALWKREPVPIALDESLLEDGAFELAESDQVVAFILKPVLMGNLEDRSIWTELASRRGIPNVYSSCFESGVGLWHLARLAEAEVASGLDTNRILAEDLVAPRPTSLEGKLQNPAGNLQVQVSG